MEKVYLSWEQSESMWRDLACKLRDNKPDLIVGIARGGLTPAVWLSHNLNVPMELLIWTTRDGDFKEHNLNVSEAISDERTVVFVDDINDTGLTFNGICDHFDHVWKEINNNNKLITQRKCFYAAMVEKRSSKFKVDYAATTVSGEEADKWFVFPWERWASE